jgi:kinesin family protein 23
MSAKLPPKPSRRNTPSQTPLRQKPKDPVEVYCRIRPLQADEDESCAEVKGPTILQLTPPEDSQAYKSGHINPTQHYFKYVFNDKANQTIIFHEVASALVGDLVSGKNGLLFAYGVTNSGKTYTMTGEPGHPGILPRVMDVLFNTIADVQATKNVFQPDQFNGYKILPEAEAKTIQRHTKPKKISPRARAETPDYGDIIRIPETFKLTGIDEDCSYSVFITYIEIYNNIAYDLLEEPDTGLHPKGPQSKTVREDSSHNMYVSNCVEVEVKSTEEAFEVLLQGQRRRRNAETQLNHESSRSHAVFNIRLVQAPLDPSGAEVLQDSGKMIISQLALVDLAGSERSDRTGNHGNRLKEAGNINQSLMTLRLCMDTLRENQRSGANKIVPYRDSKLTHLFKNYFDGEGKVRMIVCVSPKADDYDETIQVMKFSEVTQEVKVDRPTTVKLDVGLAPGRRRANMIYRSVLKDINEGNEVAPPPAPHPYQVALGVLSIQQYLSEHGAYMNLSELKTFLENRSKARHHLQADLRRKMSEFRSCLVSTEEDLTALKLKCNELQSQRTSKEKAQREVTRFKGIITSQERQISQMTSEINHYKEQLLMKDKENAQIKDQMMKLAQKNEYLSKANAKYENELHSKEKYLDQKLVESTQAKLKLEGRVNQERERFEKLAKEKEMTEKECLAKEEKLSQVRELIRNSPLTAVRGTVSMATTPLKSSASNIRDNKPKEGCAPLYTKTKGRRKRSLSENWLEHKPADTVESGDILQPKFKKKKTIVNPKAKHFKSKNVDKYVLKHQEQDSGGEVKTELYKGDILFTRTGGASVKFTDIEKLKHDSPKEVPSQSRCIVGSASGQITASGSPGSNDTSCSMDISGSTQDGEWTDVETRCAVGIESKPGGASPAFSHIRP